MIEVRPARLHDLPGAYRVGLLQGDAGQDASAIYRDPDLLGHIYVGPYIVRGRGLQLVLVDDGGVCGYLLSADDTLDFEAWAEAEWWPPLRERYRSRSEQSPDAELVGLIHEPARTPPEVTNDHPAHLHIDLMERARGKGWGRILIERLLSDLGQRGITGVHLGVDATNDNAIGFYRHLGFREVVREHGELIMGQRLG